MEKTAMQEWVEWLKAYEYELPLELQIKSKELLDVEKQQIIKSFIVGRDMSADYFDLNSNTPEEENYYNQTFKQD